MTSDQLEQRNDESRLAYVLPSASATPRGNFYAIGALVGTAFGALVVFAGFWSAMVIGGFAIIGTFVAHLMRLMADGRVDVGRGWDAMFNKDIER